MIEVVLTGSVSRGVADDVSDIEMLVVTEEQVSLEEAFELARRAGLEERDSWGDPATPTRRVSGYLDGQPVETIWWSRDHAEEHFDSGASRGGDRERDPAAYRAVCSRAGRSGLREFPEDLAAQRIEEAAERWGGFTPAGLLTIVRPGDRLQLLEWLVDAATRTLTIVFALNRTWQPTTKRLAARLEPLAVKPDRLAERIEEALTEPDPRRALAVMTELQLDTVRLAPSGPNVDRARTWLAEGLALLQRVSVLALDVGSSSVRAQQFDERGEAAGELRQEEYESDDPAEVAAAVRRVLGDEEPDATSCFAHSLVAVDEAGTRSRRSSAGATRAAPTRRDGSRSGSTPRPTHARTGAFLHPSFWPAKLAWLAETEPETFRRAAWFVSFADYLRGEARDEPRDGIHERPARPHDAGLGRGAALHARTRRASGCRGSPTCRSGPTPRAPTRAPAA